MQPFASLVAMLLIGVLVQVLVVNFVAAVVDIVDHIFVDIEVVAFLRHFEYQLSVVVMHLIFQLILILSFELEMPLVQLKVILKN